MNSEIDKLLVYEANFHRAFTVEAFNEGLTGYSNSATFSL